MKKVFRAGVGLLTLVVLAGCQTKSENLPFEVAKNRVFKAEVESTHLITPVVVEFPTEIFRVGSGLWQAGFRDYKLEANSVRRVGESDGLAFYSLSWDNEPFDRLLVPVPGSPNEYREFLSVY